MLYSTLKKKPFPIHLQERTAPLQEFVSAVFSTEQCHSDFHAES